MSKIRNFLTIVDKKDNSSGDSGSHDLPSGGQATPSEQLIGHLREIIVAPTAQMTEMRFIDMLNVIEDHRTAAEHRLDKVDRHLTEAADRATVMTFNIENHEEEIRLLRQHVGDELHAIRAEPASIIDGLRLSLDQSSAQIFGELTRRAEHFENAVREEVRSLSASLAGHLAENDRRWEEQRQNMTETLEQLIAQWRSERDNGRRQDMENLAGSMMDIGRRLMSAQPNA